MIHNDKRIMLRKSQDQNPAHSPGKFRPCERNNRQTGSL